MTRRRRFSYRRLRRRARFTVAVLVTLVAVTYLVVPWVVSVVDAGREYSPSYYEPKDQTRQEWILQRGLEPVPAIAPWQLAVNLGLVFLIVAVWLSVLPRRR